MLALFKNYPKEIKNVLSNDFSTINYLFKYVSKPLGY